MKQGHIALGEIASVPRLRQLEKQHRRSRKKGQLILLIPALCILGAIPAYLLDINWLWEALAGWCILVIFLVGSYIMWKLPVTEEIVHDYSQEVLPGLFRKLGIEKPEAFRRHNLAVKAFLDSGLFHDKYSSISREDCIQGFVHSAPFGMYQVAMQVGTTLMGGRAGMTTLKTNHFYGWFITVNIAAVPGVHVIIMRQRIHSGESDDWHSKTISHWEKSDFLQKEISGNEMFDEKFLVFTDYPQELFRLLTPETQKFLLYLAQTTQNSFAISVQKSSASLLIGHESPTFRICPEGDFTSELPVEMVDDARWFADLLKGIQRGFR